MNTKTILALALVAASGAANADKVKLEGSDTLAGVITDAIIASGMQDQLQYIGGGSGKGEAAMTEGRQGIAPMSREATAQAVTAAAARGLQLVPHVIALDGIGIFVNGTNAVAKIDIPTVAKIFTCEITKWEQIPGSNKTGAIEVYRRNDSSGTTDAFKHFTGVKKFGPCVSVVAETADIANMTSTKGNAVGYAGLSARRDANKTLAVSKDAAAQAVLPSVNTIRSFAYPMARNLYIYEAKGAASPSAVEKKFLEQASDRSFMDPIVQNNEFYTID